MKFSTNTDVSLFDAEGQDALLAEMQQQALSDFQAAATIAERTSATTTFAQASEARMTLLDILGPRRAAAKRAAQS
jgi:hypothetical protein